MAKHKVAIKRVGQPLEILDFEGTYRTDVKSMISGDHDVYLQFVTLAADKDRIVSMACDDCGMAKDLPHNFHMLTQNGNHRFFESIRGDVVFLVYRWENTYDHDIWDFQMEDLLEDDLKVIEHLLSDKAQMQYRKISELDPYVTKTPTMYFEEIEDLDEHLGLSKSPPLYEPVPIFLIASYLLTKWPVNRPITFFCDKKGKTEYTTGINAAPFSAGMTLYCKGKTLARSFEIKIDLQKGGVTEAQATKLMRTYLNNMISWNIPGMVYVDAKTKKRLHEGK